MSLSDEVYNRICWQYDTHQHDRVCYLLDDLTEPHISAGLSREELQKLILDASKDAATVQENVEAWRANLSTLPQLQAQAEENRRK